MYRKNLLIISAMLGLVMMGGALAQYMPAGTGGQSAVSNDDDNDLDYYSVVLANLLAKNTQLLPDKRSCIRRGGPCDHRPNDCCPKSACRCNLWGTNCRCNRLGLFQKWGK